MGGKFGSPLNLSMTSPPMPKTTVTAGPWELIRPANEDWTHGDPRYSPMGARELERFKNKLALMGECWLWAGCTNAAGYGVHKRGPRNSPAVLAHRLILSHVCRPVRDGEHVDHVCRNTRCINPDHPELVPPEVPVMHNTLNQVFVALDCGDILQEEVRKGLKDEIAALLNRIDTKGDGDGL